MMACGDDSACTGRWLTEPQAAELISGYGIRYPRHKMVHTHDEAVAAAAELCAPFVLKVVSPDVVHKSDVGGVITDLPDLTSVEEAYDLLLSQVGAGCPGARVEGILVAEQAPEGVELIIGGLRDPVFGPAVSVGWGGAYVELIRDTAVGLAPLTHAEAGTLLARTRVATILSGYRGRPALDSEAVVVALVAASRLMSEHQELLELDVNPLRVYEEGALALDVRARCQ